MSESDEKRSFWSRPAVKWTATVVLGLIFLLSFAIYLAADLVSFELLDPELYISALDENHFYDRIYIDLLADPALEEAANLLLGSLDLNPNLPVPPLSMATSTLRLILPAETIENSVEGVIIRLTGYLGGDLDRLEPRLDLSSKLEEGTAANAILARIQAVISDLINPEDSELEGPAAGAEDEELARYIQAISNGSLEALPPGVVSARTDQLSDGERQLLVSSLLGPAADSAPESTRIQIDSALAVNDMPGAMSFAISAILRPRVEQAVSDLKEKMEASGLDDSLLSLALFLEETEENVISRLNAIRDLMTFLDRRLIPLMFVLMALSLTGIVLLHGHALRDVLRTAGITLLATGGIVMVVWLIFRSILRSRLEERLTSGTSPLPDALASMLRDVVGTILNSVWDSVWKTALIVVVIGLILLLLSLIPQVTRGLHKSSERLREYRRPVLVIAVLVIILIPVILRSSFRGRRQAARACNGHAELCDRPINEVALATTHNSMSISNYGWVWPSHDGNLTNQLNAGVRGFLIDTHYWDDQAFIEFYLAALPEDLQAVANRALTALDLPVEDGSFLCHNLCGLGVTELAEGLSEIRIFLEDNPREVVVMVIQDAITPQDTEMAFEESGLISFVYSHKESEPWPTLGEMIDMDQRVLVMAEEGGPPPDWYHHVWDTTKETPYSFHNPEELSCEPNRGNEEGQFFLMNHWIERASPSRVDSAQLNEYQFLLDRAQQCAEERGQIPNFVAVNFYLNGDVFEVVDELNGIRQVTEQ